MKLILRANLACKIDHWAPLAPVRLQIRVKFATEVNASYSILIGDDFGYLFKSTAWMDAVVLMNRWTLAVHMHNTGNIVVYWNMVTLVTTYLFSFVPPTKRCLMLAEVLRALPRQPRDMCIGEQATDCKTIFACDYFQVSKCCLQ